MLDKFKLVSFLVLGLAIVGCGKQTTVHTNNTSGVSNPVAQTSITTNKPSQTQTKQTQATTEQPVAPEKNPVGDIPDSQVFVRFSSAQGGYSLEVPEGWARMEQAGNVVFTDKLDGVKVTTEESSKPLSIATIEAKQVTAIKNTERAVQVSSIQSINLPSGPAVLVKYTSNSEPNSVTGKQVRLDNSSYFYYKNGKLARLELWAPVGADNVDQWKRMSESFRWEK
ncbi:hypothetical protein Tfer_1696 [Thermincola ferriacetica]|uniref:Lipoprotein n=1 Tax=Thermincola ferriacetica TaxID=281456 RepID=A0A0L6W2A8_9FIRM|nr:hypothetical protein [Thermincola ferriacetica]KNZ69675.1 hypothetical protein Tfer_1696 [Thermincola ferriacetica]